MSFNKSKKIHIQNNKEYKVVNRKNQLRIAKIMKKMEMTILKATISIISLMVMVMVN
jgi:hypothetical protein